MGKKFFRNSFTDFFLLFLGFALMSWGFSMVIKSDLGAGTWDSLNLGIAKHTGLSPGRVTQIMGLLLIGVSYYFGIKPNVGTLLNMIVLGFMLDFFLLRTATAHHLVLRYAQLFFGTFLVALGTGAYITPNLGAGPRDSFMLALAKRTGWPIRTAKTTIELCVVVLGYLLGGPVGIGTLLYSITLGPMMEKSILLFRAVYPDLRKKGSVDTHT